MHNTVQFGYDMEAAVKVDGQLRWGIDFKPTTHGAYGVGHKYDVNEYTKVRVYPDGAALETGTGNNPPTCMAWVADLLYVSLLAMGDKRLQENDNQRIAGDALPTDGREMLWQDLTPIPDEMMKAAPEEVTVSGCNPRFDIVTGEMAKPIKPYRKFLMNYGIPTGYHVHCGSGGMFCNKRWEFDEHTQMALQCTIIHCLTAYAAIGHPGSVERWKAFGVGRFRPKPYGFEWTDLGTCVAKDMPLLFGILGAMRVFICDWNKAKLGKLLKAVSYQDAVAAVMEGPIAAKHIALAAHEAAYKIDHDCADDSAPWFAGQGYTVNIYKRWKEWIEAGKMNDSPTGWWHPQYTLHRNGIETAIKRGA